MKRGRKKAVSQVTKENGDEHVAVVVSDQPETQLPTQTSEQASAQEESEDAAEQAVMEKTIATHQTWQQNDVLTVWLKDKFKLAYLAPEIRYKDSRFPKDNEGRVMGVNRYYAPLNLVVDKIPATWSDEMIEAKKWAIEQLGFKYAWVQDGEKSPAPEEVYARTEKLKEKPSFQFSYAITPTQYFGDMNLRVN